MGFPGQQFSGAFQKAWGAVLVKKKRFDLKNDNNVLKTRALCNALSSLKF